MMLVVSLSHKYNIPMDIEVEETISLLLITAAFPSQRAANVGLDLCGSLNKPLNKQLRAGMAV